MSSIEEKIKNRQRRKVTPRTSMVETLVKEQVETTLEQQSAPYPVTEVTQTQPETITEIEFQDNGKLEQMPVQPESTNDDEEYKNFKLDQATLRFEQNIAQKIKRLSTAEEVSREALIEAMFLAIESQPKQRKQVLELARERTKLRKRAANWRRGQSMIRNA